MPLRLDFLSPLRSHEEQPFFESSPLSTDEEEEFDCGDGRFGIVHKSSSNNLTNLLFSESQKLASNMNFNNMNNENNIDEEDDFGDGRFGGMSQTVIFAQNPLAKNITENQITNYVVMSPPAAGAHFNLNDRSPCENNLIFEVNKSNSVPTINYLPQQVSSVHQTMPSDNHAYLRPNVVNNTEDACYPLSTSCSTPSPILSMKRGSISVYSPSVNPRAQKRKRCTHICIG